MGLPGGFRLQGSDVVNLAVALALGAIGMLEIWVPLTSRNFDGRPVLTAVSVWVGCLALVVRRWARVRVLLTAFGLQLALHLFGPVYVLFYGQALPAALLMYSAVRHGRRLAPLAGGLSTAVMLALLIASEPEMQNANEVAYQYGTFGLVWAAAFALRVQARRVHANQQRAVAAEVAAAAQAMAAVNEERTRIARELHDIVAHSVSVMVVQAGAAEQVTDDQEYVGRALATIRSTGAAALDDMRRVVAMIRDPELSSALAPQPGISALPGLLDQTRDGGLEVGYTVSGTSRELPPGLDLAAYRIIQEALTNVRKHARASRVDVVLRYEVDGVQIEVTDDGVGARDQPAGGHGLVGMQERAAMYGGSVETSQDQGFSVRAVLPGPVARGSR